MYEINNIIIITQLIVWDIFFGLICSNVSDLPEFRMTSSACTVTSALMLTAAISMNLSWLHRTASISKMWCCVQSLSQHAWVFRSPIDRFSLFFPYIRKFRSVPGVTPRSSAMDWFVLCSSHHDTRNVSL